MFVPSQAQVKAEHTGSNMTQDLTFAMNLTPPYFSLSMPFSMYAAINPLGEIAHQLVTN